jgi:RNA polymerase sigma-70 factor (ECF subfamily)
MTDHGTIAETGEISRMSRSQEEPAFAAQLERHRRELHIHCYRMLASFDDAEDAVQDAFLRAWRYRDSRDETVPVRPWLYRIATNACLDLIARDRKRLAVSDDATGEPGEITWLQPYPDALLELAAPREGEPDAIVVTKETIELAFLTVIQLLTPQQRAALILCDVLGWPAAEAAATLETTVASVNGALQRARATLRKRLPRKAEWPTGVDATEAERELVRKFVEASEQADVSWFASVIREDAVFRMPPEPGETVGRDAMMQLWVEGGFGTSMQLEGVPTRCNRQPAVAFYNHGEAMALDVIRIEEGMITEVITFPGSVFEQFGLPSTI